jgi:hypothetical protein
MQCIILCPLRHSDTTGARQSLAAKVVEWDHT